MAQYRYLHLRPYPHARRRLARQWFARPRWPAMPRACSEFSSRFVRLDAAVWYRLAQGPPVHPRLASLEAQPALGKPAYRQRVDSMLLSEYACAQRIFGIIGANGNARLDDARTAVQFFADKMHGGAVLAVARLDGAPMRMQARVLGQQRGMNVQDFSRKSLQKLRRQNAHEPRKCDQ